MDPVRTTTLRLGKVTNLASALLVCAGIAASDSHANWSYPTDGNGLITMAPGGEALVKNCSNNGSSAALLGSAGDAAWDLASLGQPSDFGVDCSSGFVDEQANAYLRVSDWDGTRTHHSLQAVNRHGEVRWKQPMRGNIGARFNEVARIGDAIYYLDGAADGYRSVLRGRALTDGHEVIEEPLPLETRTAHDGVFASGDSVGWLGWHGSAWFDLGTRTWRFYERELPGGEDSPFGPYDMVPAPGGQVIGLWVSNTEALGLRIHVQAESADGEIWRLTSPVGPWEGSLGELALAPAPDGGAFILGANARTGGIGRWLSRVRPGGTVAWVRPLSLHPDAHGYVLGELRASTDGTLAYSYHHVCDPDEYWSRYCVTVDLASGRDGSRVGRLSVLPRGAQGSVGLQDLRLAPGRLLVAVGDEARAPYGGFVHSIDVPGLGGELETELTAGARFPAPAAHDRVWAALGDSFSAGEGVPPFDAGTDVGPPSVNRCHRTGSAFGRVAAGNLAGSDITLGNGRKQRLLGYPVHVACSGAIAADLVSPFAENHTPAINREEGAQIDAISPQSTKVVTLTIGGNDAGFADVLKNCLALGVGQGLLSRGRSFFDEPSVTCKRLFAKQVRDRIELQRGRLQNTLWFVKRRAHPDARVLVLAYPQIFPSSPPAQCWGIARGDVTWMHAEQARMNRVLREEAGAAGVEFVDTESVTAGHDACQLDPVRRWMHGPYIESLNPLENIEYSFHPTEAGQAAMARAVEQRLKEPPPGAQAQGLGDGVTRRLQVDVGPTGGVAGSDARHSGSTSSGSRSGVAATRADSSGSTPKQASFVVSWSIGDLQTTLTDPSGRTYTAASDAVKHERADGLERFTIPDGDPGRWTVELSSEQTDGNEADVTVTSSLAQAQDPRPSAVFETSASSVRAGEEFGFDASNSFGSEPITSWSWDFGDGTAGAGERARHAYATPGSYEPTLTVRTASGASDVFTGPAVLVDGGPPVPQPQPGSSPTAIGLASTPATGGLVPSPLRPITTTRVTARTQTATVRLRKSDCSTQRLRISGTGVSIAKVKRLRSGRCRLTLRVRSDARTGKRRLLIKRGTRTVRTPTRITIRPAARKPAPARATTALGQGRGTLDADRRRLP